ncbi:hypothetical protein [Nocardia sp. BMG111209]|uniref:hypothetical protein n=1 Tax=Nocardia sp. BMG111209 TaxID=1160137 RepID=UPI000378C747|nr:hypothetical protein [Nocardia sp. BMG111209]
MVTTTGTNLRSARKPLHRNMFRLLTVAVTTVIAAMVTFGAAAADPVPAGGSPGSSYGFDRTCNDLHDAVSGIGIPDTPLNLGNLVSGACKAGNVATHPDKAAGAVADAAWNTAFGKVVQSLISGLSQAIVLSLSFWAKLPTAITDSPDLFTKISDYTYQLQWYLLAISVIVCGVRLAQARRHAMLDAAHDTFKVLARTVFASTMWTAVLVAGTHASDALANWILDDATGGDPKTAAKALTETEGLSVFSPGLVLILACVGILGALAQVVLAVVRQGLLVVVAGVLPLAAAGSGTASGRGLFEKLVGWSVAFLLYKPLAALVYLIAFTTVGHTAIAGTGSVDAESAQRALVGLVLLCSAGLTLPAIMRLVSPVAGMAGGSGAAAAAGAATAGAAGFTMLSSRATGAVSGKGGASGGQATAGSAAGGSAATGAVRAASTASGMSGGGIATAAKAAGPVGAAAAAGIGVAAKGIQTVQTTVEQSTTTGGPPPARPYSGPSGTEVPR